MESEDFAHFLSFSLDLIILEYNIWTSLPLKNMWRKVDATPTFDLNLLRQDEQRVSACGERREVRRRGIDIGGGQLCIVIGIIASITIFKIIDIVTS